MPKHFSRTTSRTKTLWRMHSLRPRQPFRTKSLHPRSKNISSNSSLSSNNPSFMFLKQNLNQLLSHHLQHQSKLFNYHHKTHQPTFSWFVHHHHPPTKMAKSSSSSTQTSGKNIKPPSQQVLLLPPQLQHRLKQQINSTSVLVALLIRQTHSHHPLLRLFQFNQNAASHPNHFVLQQQRPKTLMELPKNCSPSTTDPT